MGCICSKGIQSDEIGDTTRRGKVSRKHSLSVRRFVGASPREEVSTFEPEGLNDRDGRTRLILKPSESNIVTPIFSDEDKKIEKPRRSHQRHSTVDFVASDDHSLWVGSVSKGIEGEQVAAGWPSWLSKVAGEALKGWVPRKADSFEKLDKIGQGTYSHVYRARDLETGKIVALKKVRFVNLDLESVRFMAREIHILRRLDHPNVIKLEGLVTSRMSCSLYLVFEYMEHDLAGLAANPSIKFTEPQIKCYMQQLLRGLEHSHSRGVLHRDIKGSNLLIDNNGILRIGDYGLATFFQPDQTQPLTSRVVTLWYRPPELLLGSTSYGVAVDLWSTGCILAELFAGKPIMPGRTEVEQLHKIFKLCGSPAEDYWKKSKLPHATIFKPQHPYKRCIADTFKDIPPSAFALVDTLLAIEPADRGTALSALKSDFFGTHPLPCDPSSLPKYPPSKEFDAKLRDEARRQKATGGREREIESVGKRTKESGYLRAPDANAELQTSLQRRQGQSNPKSNSEKYNPQAEDAGSGFPIDPPRGVSRGTANGISHSGPLLHPSAWGSSWHSNKKDRMNKLQAQGGAGRVSKGLMGEELKSQRSFMPAETSHAYDNLSLRGNGYIDNQSDRGSSHNRRQKKYGQLEVAEPSEKQEWNHLLDPHDSNKKDERPDNRGAFGKKNRIHYSGPLMPPSGNLEEMLKEHERQIQQAVRKARLDKAKTKKLDGEQAQYEALLVPGRNGRSDL